MPIWARFLTFENQMHVENTYLVALFRKNASRSNKNRIQIPDAATGAAAFALTMYGLRPRF